ncbi:MAG: radical SAM/SPASM domain-containing protein [Candidatus Aquicultorales bacterium]
MRWSRALEYLYTGKHSPRQLFNAALAQVDLGPLVLNQPVELIFNVTDECTLRCQVCMNHSPALPETTDGYHNPCKNLSFALFKQVVDTFPGAMRVCLAGVGEPLLNPEIFSMLDYAKDKKAQVTMISNGTLLASSLESLAGSSPDILSISLNAPEPESFKVVCNSSTSAFSRVIEGIEAFVGVRRREGLTTRVGLSSVLKRSLLDFAEPMVALADSLGVDFLDFHNLIPSALPGCGPEECLFEDDPVVADALERLSPPEGLNLGPPKLLKREVEGWKCKSFHKVLYVDGEGNVSGCYRVFPPDRSNGSVFEQGVWRNGYFAIHRRELLKEEIPNACLYCVDLS